MLGNGWDWNGLRQAKAATQDGASASAKAQQNAPSIVLGEIGLILALTLSLALAINLTLSILNIH